MSNCSVSNFSLNFILFLALFFFGKILTYRIDRILWICLFWSWVIYIALRSHTAAQLQPLRTRLADMDLDIAAQEALVRALRATTHANEAKIQRLLAAVAFSANSS